MFTKRIIPCLDVHAGRVVKGVNFVNLRDAGDPVEIAAAYDKAGADELVFLDITASSDNRKTVVDMVRRVAETVFIPFTVGGGIRTKAPLSRGGWHAKHDWGSLKHFSPPDRRWRSPSPSMKRGALSAAAGKGR